MTLSIPDTLEFLEQIVDGGEVATGCQAYFSQGNNNCALSYGQAAPGLSITDKTMWKLYCNGKPIVSIAIAILLREYEISLDDPITRYYPEFTNGGKEEITFRHILNHTAGLSFPRAIDVAFDDINSRETKVRELSLSDNYSLGEESNYSEYVGWHVLGRVIERVARTGVGMFLQDNIFGPLQMQQTRCGFTSAQYKSDQDQIGIFYDCSGSHPVPMLYDRSKSLCCEWNPSYGLYASAHDIGVFYESLLSSFYGGSGILSKEDTWNWTQQSRGSIYDPVLEQPCEFTLGFMKNLGDFGIGTHTSDLSFGHLGYRGTSLAFCDPSYNLVAVVILNGILEIERARSLRQEMVDLLYRELQIVQRW